MLYKMLGIESTYEHLKTETRDKLPRCRQMFVTQSRLLVDKFEENYHKLRTLQNSDRRTMRESVKMSLQKRTLVARGLFDRDEQAMRQGAITSLNELTDEHYPLFVTFDQVGQLLEHTSFTMHLASTHP